uniref:Uncharacterized protein n=1 Tax=Arundo donax TaxID=35708 RepID=A0A0A9A4K8_ARUDO
MRFGYWTCNRTLIEQTHGGATLGLVSSLLDDPRLVILL